MHRLTIEVITAMCAWAISAVGQSVSTGRLCPQGGPYNMIELVKKLSPAARIYCPGTEEFEEASIRWSVLEEPKVNVIVVPGTVDDVAETVKFANQRKLPFLAYNGAHGAVTTLGKMDHGIEILMHQLSSVEIAKDGKTAKVGGGTMSKTVTDTLWEAGKQTGKLMITVTGACECVSLLGPGLGGGHGWLQGHYGLIADQFVSMDIVMADGSRTIIDKTSSLWWAMKGAGHNFGIVTAVTTKIYDIKHRDWAIETLVFGGDKVEAVYQAANDHFLTNKTQPVDVIHWSYWLNNLDANPNKPVIIFYVIQEGVKAVDTVYTKPFHDIGPLSAEAVGGSYTDLAEWTDISTSAPPCQKAGLANPRFPIYLELYNVTAQRKAYDLFASAARGSSTFSRSVFMFEGYSMQGVQGIDPESTAFAFRDANLLVAPLITYLPADSDLDKRAAKLGEQLRQILYEGSGRKELRAYINYSYGDETLQQWYGNEKWRQDRLQALKRKYDPEGKFSFYAPIA
ncbi:hypothetical protein AJ80_08671 [Polytolypa hystricis UAMH7299]|uniref:FAD-binding PCMH-type domain-containing protein n=1 Tax=Polytolypa hystricis (strain UAMH7299) TaxID=1447883 RepID=A0A2B7X3S3_POLH7|nr:hypothetical protein AJ80_08671 [Polytolypa hystricis UAMH7299]